jgi:hypothetical protein
MVLQAALEAMKAHGLGEDTVTDILAIGFSATDVIGHTYGADSQEVMTSFCGWTELCRSSLKRSTGA